MSRRDTRYRSPKTFIVTRTETYQVSFTVTESSQLKARKRITPENARRTLIGTTVGTATEVGIGATLNTPLTHTQASE